MILKTCECNIMMLKTCESNMMMLKTCEVLCCRPASLDANNTKMADGQL